MRTYLPIAPRVPDTRSRKQRSVGLGRIERETTLVELIVRPGRSGLRARAEGLGTRHAAVDGTRHDV